MPREKEPGQTNRDSMLRGNKDHGDHRSSQEKNIANQGNMRHQSAEEMNASFERGMQSAFELSKSVVAGRGQALGEQERRDREFPERADQAPKLDPNALLFGEEKPDRFVFGAETDNEIRDDMVTESEVHQLDEDGRAHRRDEPGPGSSTEGGTGTEPASPTISSDTSEDTSEDESERGVRLPRGLQARLDNMRKQYAMASKRKPFEKIEVSPSDGEASPQPATPSAAPNSVPEHEPEPQPRPARQDISTMEGAMAVNQPGQQQQAAPLTTTDRPADGEASQQPETPPVAPNAVPEHEPEPQPHFARQDFSTMEGIMAVIRQGQQQQAAPLTTADRPTDEEASQRPAAPATPAAPNPVPAHEGEARPRPAQEDPNPLRSLKKRLKAKQEGQKTQKGTADSSDNGGAGEQRTTSQKTANSSADAGASQQKTTPQNTENSPANGEASRQQTTPQKTANSPADREASQQQTTPQGTPKILADRKAAQQQTTPQQTPGRPTHGAASQQATPQQTPDRPTHETASRQTTPQQTPDRPTHGTASQGPATPAAPNAAPEYNPFAPQGPMTFNLPGRGLEDLGPQGILDQLAASRTNAPQPPPPSPPQPSPVAPEAPDAGEHNPFTGRRGPPSSPDLTNPGPESFNAQNTLGQGAADPPAAPATRQLPTALAEMNEAVARFEAYREPPPSPPDDSSSSWSSSSDEEEDHGSMSGSMDCDGDQAQPPNRDMQRICIVSPAASPAGFDHNGDARRDSSENQLVHPDRRGLVEADCDSDSTLSDPDEGESRRRMALNQVSAGHDSEMDDEELHVPNRGGWDSDYDASPPRQNRAPETRERSGDSPLRLGNHRVVEPVRSPNPSQILRSIGSPLFNGGPRLGNHEVVTPAKSPFSRPADNPFFRPANNPFGQGNPEAEGQANSPSFRLGSAMAGVNHLLPHTAPSWRPPLQEPAAQPTDAVTVFADHFRNTPAPWVTYTRSLSERGAAFTRDFARGGPGFHEGREVTPPEGARATLIRQAERHSVTPVVWKASLRVVKRVPQRAGPRSEGLIAKAGNRKSKPAKSGTEASASRSRAGGEPRSLRSDYLTRPFRSVLEEHVERHTEHNPFSPASRRASPSPEPESPPEHREPEQNDERKDEQKEEHKYKRKDEEDEMRRLMAEVKELDEADQELFREVMLETEARADAGLDVSDFFGPLARSLGGRERERRGSYTRCTPTTEPTPDTEASPDVKSPTPPDPVTEVSPRSRGRRLRRRTANATYPSRPFSDPHQAPQGPELPPYSPSETMVQTIRRFPLRLAREIEDGNIDGIQLFLRMLMVLILIWVAFVIAMGDGEDHEAHWYVARGEPQMWQAGS